MEEMEVKYEIRANVSLPGLLLIAIKCVMYPTG